MLLKSVSSTSHQLTLFILLHMGFDYGKKSFLSLEYAMHLCTTLSLFYFWLRAGLAFGIKVTFQILKAPSVALIHAWMNLSLDFLLLYRITEIIKQGSLIVFTMSSFSLNFQIRALLQKTLFQCIL